MSDTPAAPDETGLTTLGHDLLGPVFHRWLAGLHQYVGFFDGPDTVFLYCARAGVRIKTLYDLYLRGTGFAPGAGRHELFWVSRVSVTKGVFHRDPDRAADAIAREYLHRPMSELVTGLLRHNPDYFAEVDVQARELAAHGENFPGFMKSDFPAAKVLRRYFADCGKAFDAYLAEIVGDASRAVLVDSGWQGSTQSLLRHAYPETAWKGLYFGRILTDSHDHEIVPEVVGLMFEAEHYNPARPVTALTLHRHLVETILEPNGRSVEEIPAGKFDDRAQRLIATNRNAVPDPVEDRLYLGIRTYIEENAGAGLAEIEARYQAVLPDLARIITTPVREEALALYCKSRSADFGKSLNVPVLIAADDPRFTDAHSRIRHALWPQGQVALEYSGQIARDMQLQMIGVTEPPPSAASASGDTAEETTESGAEEAAAARPPKVAVITRTKNRPLLLKRAAQSVERQTFKDYVWVVVNDGGDEEAVTQVIRESGIDRRKIILVSNETSLGMEAASNIGIRALQSDYLIIHDDDDSLHPSFLEKTVGFLEGPSGRKYGGVITQTTYVSEEIRGDEVIEHDTHPYNDWVRNVHIAEMMTNNIYAPIAFLYRRSVYDEVGGYNEDLPVLGDWFFNLEFLLKADIGVLFEPLAFYHHRDRVTEGDGGSYSNSVIGGRSKHEEYASITRNMFLRKYAKETPAAMIAVLGYMMNDLRRPNAGDVMAPPALATAASADSDRVRLIADINWLVSRPLALGPVERLRARPLSPDASWDEVDKAVRICSRKITVPANFNETAYLSANPDVAAEIRAGKIPNGYVHYILYGRKEGRRRPT